MDKSRLGRRSPAHDHGTRERNGGVEDDGDNKRGKGKGWLYDEWERMECCSPCGMCGRTGKGAATALAVAACVSAEMDGVCRSRASRSAASRPASREPPHLSLGHDVRRSASSAGEGAQHVLGLGECLCRDGGLRMCGDATGQAHESLAVPLAHCRRGVGEVVTSVRRTAGSSRLRVIAIQASPAWPRAVHVFAFQLPAALAGCSTCISGPLPTSKRVFGGGVCMLRLGMWRVAAV
ncbi:hypothetical protein B0H13DRAFT_1898202 [Mycena leptocephala]|nr:hypothetical protein B0H13DRAFT_1898202 [Mycena leptocephala]